MLNPAAAAAAPVVAPVAAPVPVTPPVAAAPAPAPVPPATPAPAPAAVTPKPTPLQNLRGLIAGRAELTAQLDASRQLVATRDAELAEACLQLSAVTGERDSFAVRIQCFEAGNAAYIADLTALENDRVEFDQLVGESVSSVMGALGVPANTLPAASDAPVGTSPDEIFTKWETLKGKDKATYYKLHEKILSKPRPAASAK